MRSLHGLLPTAVVKKVHVYEETARLIPDCTLRMYEGTGHGAVMDKRFCRDVLDFVARRTGIGSEAVAQDHALAGV